MTNPDKAQQMFVAGEGFRVAGHPADAIAIYTDLINIDPYDAGALHMRGVAFGMRMNTENRRMLTQAGFVGDFAGLMLDDLLAARERYVFDENAAGLAHVARDIGKAWYLGGDFTEARTEMRDSIAGFDALERPAESAMSRSFLGRVSMLEWANLDSPSSSDVGATMLRSAEMDFSQSDRVLREEGAEAYELYGKPAFALTLAILRNRQKAKEQLERAHTLNDAHGNAMLAMGIRAVSVINRLEPVVPEFAERQAVRKLLAH